MLSQIYAAFGLCGHPAPTLLGGIYRPIQGAHHTVFIGRVYFVGDESAQLEVCFIHKFRQLLPFLRHSAVFRLFIVHRIARMELILDIPH